jgi:hypothetical protein
VLVGWRPGSPYPDISVVERDVMVMLDGDAGTCELGNAPPMGATVSEGHQQRRVLRWVELQLCQRVFEVREPSLEPLKPRSPWRDAPLSSGSSAPNLGAIESRNFLQYAKFGWCPRCQRNAAT